MLIYPAAIGADLLRFYRDFMLAAPDEVGGGVAFITAPPAPFVPPEVQGQPIVAIVVSYAGPVEDGEEVLAPLREFGPARNRPRRADAVRRGCSGLIEPGNPHGMHNYWTADFYDTLPDEAIDALVEHATQPVSPLDADHRGPRRRRGQPVCPTRRRRSASVTRSGTSTTCRCGPTPPTPP